ncbi:telomeric repeat-binding factor 2-interacting protein 1-like [Ylistrum balloti]|uniref:telomeric repeat-binding factor 2-interacting protein 1-like n=1 Tax=Ylistrum balloti TaxID=509963 RepID=UPI002905F0D1|nr:telomeric repeat-binding factor 2-interacting protein 1-like [Ylistrum balloti]
MAAEKESYSKFLFTDDNGEPLIFYMRPCAAKTTLKPLVENGGGGMTVKVTKKCIKLAVETDQISSEDYISTKYILDCVKDNKLLAIDKYRLKPKKCSADHSLDEVEISDDLSPAAKIQKTGTLPLGRQKYTLQEDLSILNYFEKNRESISMWNGLKVWQTMSLLQVTEHSAESMKDRFRKKILPKLDSYNVSSNLKFLFTKKTKYITECSLKQVESGHGDSFDEYLLDSVTTESPKKGSYSIRVVLKDVLKSDKEKSSPPKKAMSEFLSPKEKSAKENSVEIGKTKQKSTQLSDDLNKGMQKMDEEVGQHDGPSLRKRKTNNVKQCFDSSSQSSKEASDSITRLKKRPKTSVNQPSMVEKQRDKGTLKPSSAKSPLPLSRSNVKNANGLHHTSDKAKRLDYVMEKFFESEEDKIFQLKYFDEFAPSERTIHNLEKESSEEEDQKDVKEEEIEETIYFVKDLMKKYDLTAKQVLHALFINNGCCDDTMSWIETGLNTAGLPAWDHRDDERLMMSSVEESTLDTLRTKYGRKTVTNRLMFLEGL